MSRLAVTHFEDPVVEAHGWPVDSDYVAAAHTHATEATR